MYTPDRQYISQYAQDVLGFTVTAAGVLADPDQNLVHVQMVNDQTQTTVVDRDAPRSGVGDYRTQLTSAETTTPGNYTVRWTYQLGGAAEVHVGLAEIGQASPPYDALAPGMKEVVDQVWVRFADLFDSPLGGPNLQTYFQANFGRGRIAQMLRQAVGRLNTIAQPYMTYTIDGDGGASFPVVQWGPLLEQATYVEVLKHLRRSYVEQPEFVGGSVARLDRRDYMDRWGQVLADEEDDLRNRLSSFKIANMGLGRPSVLVAGGVYGRWAPTRYAGSAAARGIWYSRGYF